MSRSVVHTHDAPQAIGTYSQAIRVGETVYLSGQIPLDPATGALVGGGFEAEARRVFDNLRAVADAAGYTHDRSALITVYDNHHANFPIVNNVMSEYFSEPYPARVTIGVASLPRVTQTSAP